MREGRSLPPQQNHHPYSSPPLASLLEEYPPPSAMPQAYRSPQIAFDSLRKDTEERRKRWQARADKVAAENAREEADSAKTMVSQAGNNFKIFFVFKSP